MELFSEIIIDSLLVPGEKEKCQMKTDFFVNIYFSFSYNSRMAVLLFAGNCRQKRGKHIEEAFVPRNSIPESLILLNGQSCNLNLCGYERRCFHEHFVD